MAWGSRCLESQNYWVKTKENCSLWEKDLYTHLDMSLMTKISWYKLSRTNYVLYAHYVPSPQTGLCDNSIKWIMWRLNDIVYKGYSIHRVQEFSHYLDWIHSFTHTSTPCKSVIHPSISPFSSCLSKWGSQWQQVKDSKTWQTKTNGHKHGKDITNAARGPFCK